MAGDPRARWRVEETVAMTEDTRARRVPAQAGWIIEVSYDHEGEEMRARWAVVEWEYDRDGPSTSALCLGPLGADAMELAEIDITGRAEGRLRMAAPDEFRGSIRPSPAPRPLARLRETAICPVCEQGELTRMDGPPEWYLIPAATLGLPDDAEKRVGHGLPVGMSVCSHCEHVALFLPPTIDRPERSGAPGRARRAGRRSDPVREGLLPTESPMTRSKKVTHEYLGLSQRATSAEMREAALSRLAEEADEEIRAALQELVTIADQLAAARAREEELLRVLFRLGGWQT